MKTQGVMDSSLKEYFEFFRFFSPHWHFRYQHSSLALIGPLDCTLKSEFRAGGTHQVLLMNVPSMHQCCNRYKLVCWCVWETDFCRHSVILDSGWMDWMWGGGLYMCLTEGTNATLVGGQRHSEVHSRLILLSTAVAAGDKHYGECDARHHCV